MASTPCACHRRRRRNSSATKFPWHEFARPRHSRRSFVTAVQKDRNTMTKLSKIRSVELLACDAGWRNYHFVKITTEDGIVGWSEFDEGFGAPGVGGATQRLAARGVGREGFAHGGIYAERF